MRSRAVVLAIIVMFATSTTVAADAVLGRKRNSHSISGYTYGVQYDFESEFPTNISGNCRSRVTTGAQQWNNVNRQLRFFNAPGTYGSMNWHVDVNWDDLAIPNTALYGITTNFPVFGNINFTWMSFNITPDKPGGGWYLWYCGTAQNGFGEKYDMISAAAHEFGHAIELLHSSTGADTMYPTMAVGSTNKRSLTVDDQDGIRAMYPAH